jgi:tRNA(Arg) A34 adenosine deaminase TadA
VEQSDADLMRVALAEADAAMERRNYPCGCVLARAGRVFAQAGNEVYDSGNAIRHGEIVALDRCYARQGRGGPMILADVTAYVTTEPCLMCALALLRAGVRRVVWGIPGEDFRPRPTRELLRALGLLDRFEWVGGVLENECRALLEYWRAYRRDILAALRGLDAGERQKLLQKERLTPAHLEMWTRGRPAGAAPPGERGRN